MRLQMIEKAALSAVQARLVEQRLSLEIHRDDQGPPKVWRIYANNLFAFFKEDTGKLVALVEASGSDNVSPGWWIDSEFRGQGYGKKVVDLLAKHLKDHGVSSIGRIPITTHHQQYDQQSIRLARRLRSHFET